ncbi:MAG TPA: ATP synthase F1 subunit delta [Bryobacteraceae bacterium]|nr:ATP synthase F1 subunit delta [Bryobacteraceae bacterium]
MISAVASRYANALLDVVLQSPVKPAEVTAQIASVEALIAGNEDLRHVLETPAVPGSRKRAVLGDLAGPLGLSPLVRNFIFVIVDHRRIGYLSQIREAFEQFVDEKMGFVRANVSSAQKLDERQSRALEAELEKLTGKRVRAEYEIDPMLVGGATARIGSTVYDGSVHGQLESLRRKLTQGAQN